MATLYFSAIFQNRAIQVPCSFARTFSTRRADHDFFPNSQFPTSAIVLRETWSGGGLASCFFVRRFKRCQTLEEPLDKSSAQNKIKLLQNPTLSSTRQQQPVTHEHASAPRACRALVGPVVDRPAAKNGGALSYLPFSQQSCNSACLLDCLLAFLPPVREVGTWQSPAPPVLCQCMYAIITPGRRLENFSSSCMR